MNQNIGKIKKGKILAVGYIINGIPANWQFDCLGKIPAVTITADKQIFYAGYSISELEEISKEFWGFKEVKLW